MKTKLILIGLSWAAGIGVAGTVVIGLIWLLTGGDSGGTGMCS